MPFPVACRCGQRFMAPDELAGRQLPCPTCGQPIVIQRPAAQVPQPAAASLSPAASSVVAQCQCGRSYQVPASSAGQMLGCPACGKGIQVPFAHVPDPFQQAAFAPQGGSGPQVFGQPLGFAPTGFGPQPGMSALGATPALGGPGQIPSRKAPDAPPASSNTGLWIGLGVGGAVLAIGVAAIAVFAMSDRRPAQVAQVPTNVAMPPVAATPAPPTEVATPVVPVPEASTTPTPTPSTAYKPMVESPAILPPTSLPSPSTSSAATPPTTASSPSNIYASSVPDSASPMPLVPSTSASKPAVAIPGGAFESALSQFHQAARPPFSGIRRVGNSEIEQMHFSWMVELLPYLNHREIYARFRFDKPLTEGTNMAVATKVIPEFLMPGDDRQRWKGYPFDGLALTHFAGMSGVEDARNVVAAKLPRSDPRAGVFGYQEIAKPNEITDGTSQTIMMVGAGKNANPWAMGGGATIRGAREPYFDKLSGLGTKGPGGGTLVVMADGSVRQVSDKIDPQIFRAMCTIHGKESVDLEKHTTVGKLK